MAWDNRGNEPRREYTEQVIGLLFILLFFFIDHLLVSHYGDYTPTAPFIVLQYVVGAIVLALSGLALFVFIFGGWYLAHEIGEGMCAVMKDLGFDPRPSPRENSYEYRKVRGLL